MVSDLQIAFVMEAAHREGLLEKNNLDRFKLTAEGSSYLMGRLAKDFSAILNGELDGTTYEAVGTDEEAFNKFSKIQFDRVRNIPGVLLIKYLLQDLNLLERDDLYE